MKAPKISWPSGWRGEQRNTTQHPQSESLKSRPPSEFEQDSIKSAQWRQESVPTNYDSGDYRQVAPDDPAKPVAWYRKRRLSISTIAADVAAILIPLLILVFVTQLSNLDGSRTDQVATRWWQDAINLLATAFPIIFAAVIGRLMSAVARWKLENGTSMQSLEQLMGSRTVGATLRTLVEFRIANIITLAMLFIWAFSPLGSQAVLRVLDTRLTTSYVPDPTIVTYFDVGGRTALNTLPIGGALTSAGTSTTTTLGYLAALYTSFVAAPQSRLNSPMDHFGNVKIPMVEKNASQDWWTYLSPDAGNHTYSSLFGIPLDYGTGAGRNLTFNIESNYIDLDCHNITKFPAEHPRDSMTAMSEDLFLDNGTFGDGILKQPNGTWRGYQSHMNETSGATWAIALDRFVHPFWTDSNLQDGRLKQDLPANSSDLAAIRDGLRLFTNETDIEVGSANLLLQIAIPKSDSSSAVNAEAVCGISTKYVESMVDCTYTPTTQRHFCRVVAQRPLNSPYAPEKPHPPEAISQLSLPRVFHFLSRELPRAGNSRGLEDFTMQYLKDPRLAGLPASSISLDDLDETLLGRRFGQLVNTYLMLSQVPLQGGGDVLGTRGRLEPNITEMVTTFIDVEVYRVSLGWITVCLTACVVLLLGGVLGAVFTHLARGPEVLGYVSAIVRESKLIEPVMNTNWMEGGQLAREMGSSRVRHGYTSNVVDGEPLLGVGYEADIRRIKDRR
ncbi:hypothetical protein C8035_v012480 [Colletotrichum spinosum]|uniref:Uncharacterized protein n=1 Tax=Colletotrichum spinosum TaxID=1347390 RepID=A0A4R8Q9E9_9PEZI|nr:hypothetical protein C8035_v012480 [Colletotrichum spinosum]